MGILKVAGKVLLIPLWFIISIICKFRPTGVNISFETV